VIAGGLLREVTFDGTWKGWRAAARASLASEIAPSAIVWRAGELTQGSFLADEHTEDSSASKVGAGAPVPREFLSLGADVACCRAPAPWDALYRVLWRLTHGERALLDVYVDADVHALHRMAKAVRREGHKLRAFVRFRLVSSGTERERYVAWFEPAHDVLPREAPFFARRFPAMDWSILTPDCSAHWDGGALTIGAGVPRAAAPGGDPLEDLWRTYYSHTFNPARTKPKMMRAEMPVRYWKYLPEASLIAPLLREAPTRVHRMLDAQASPGAAPLFPVLDRAAVRGAPPEGDDVTGATDARHHSPADRSPALPHRGGATPSWEGGEPHDEGVGVAATRSQRAREILDARGIPCGATPLDGRTVRIGTASWTDPTMTAPGVFYPDEARDASARLAYYASRFSLVEVDSTYYALPSERTAALWAERTPPGFVFDVKAHGLMTGHATSVARLPADLRAALPEGLRSASSVRAESLPAELLEEVWRRFASALAPLARADKLGAVLLQLPRGFDATPAHERAVLRLRERGGALPLAVEFRHASWVCDDARERRTMEMLRANDLAFVMVDAPPGFITSMPPVVAVTSDRLAIVRLHGRRRETWERPVQVVSERYRYLYDARELGDWVPRIVDVAQRTQGVHVIMNNCHANYGTSNADEITALLVEFDRERRLV
jgi:probable DNA metabolism protein